MHPKKHINGAVAGIGFTLLFLLSGCNLNAPRARMGTLPTPPPGPRFLNPDNLGAHSYYFNPFEKNGIVYACKAGHLDVTHIRWNADWTKYVAEKTYSTLMKKGDGFSYNLQLEVSSHIVSFDYPDNWDTLSQQEKEKIAHEISLHVGPYVAFNTTLWHEILTWFGVHFFGFEEEFNSAFTWEDLYSNALGVKLAVEAMKNNALDYDSALTLALEQKLERLGIQPRSTAVQAAEKMRGQWFEGYLFVDTFRKNMDTGLDDGIISPVLVPGICQNPEAEPIQVPDIDILAKYGFSMEYKILPREWEKGKFLKIVYPDKKGKYIYPEKHFPILMEYIKKQAVEKYGYILEEPDTAQSENN